MILTEVVSATYGLDSVWKLYFSDLYIFKTSDGDKKVSLKVWSPIFKEIDCPRRRMFDVSWKFKGDTNIMLCLESFQTAPRFSFPLVCTKKAFCTYMFDINCSWSERPPDQSRGNFPSFHFWMKEEVSWGWEAETLEVLGVLCGGTRLPVPRPSF